jgi:hypothetical protein
MKVLIRFARFGRGVAMLMIQPGLATKFCGRGRTKGMPKSFTQWALSGFSHKA